MPVALELLHKLVPAADPIAYLARAVAASDLPGTGEQENLQSAARTLGVRLLALRAATESEIAAAFSTIVEQHAGALLLSGGVISPAAFNQIKLLAVAMPSRPCFSPAIELRAASGCDHA